MSRFSLRERCYRARARWLPYVLIVLATLGCDGDSPTEPNILADFTFSGEGPVVEFFDASAGPVSQWLWDFGDGETSTVRSPVHRYLPMNLPETFIVRLTVCATAEFQPDDCSSVEKPVRVSEDGPPV